MNLRPDLSQNADLSVFENAFGVRWRLGANWYVNRETVSVTAKIKGRKACVEFGVDVFTRAMASKRDGVEDLHWLLADTLGDFATTHMIFQSMICMKVTHLYI